MASGKEKSGLCSGADQTSAASFPPGLRTLSYLSQRELQVRDEHQSKTADDRIEGIVLQVKLLGIHDARGDSGQPLLLGQLARRC